MKTFEDDLFYIGDAVAVGVLHIIKIRRASDEHAAFPRHDAVGKGEAIGENGAFVVMAVVVRTFEEDNLADGRFAFAGAGRITAVFRNEHAALFIPGDGNRTHDHWLGGDAFNFEAGIESETFDCLFRR